MLTKRIIPCLDCDLQIPEGRVVKGVEFKQIRVDEDPKGYMELKEKTNHQTVPQIFVDGQFIGGAKEFFEWMPG